MPSTGTLAFHTAWGARGASFCRTDSGPPDRMMPLGLNAATSASLTSQGWISQYTPSSRTRRAMSCVYWEPKSRMRMRWAWMSCMSADAVIRRFLGDLHVVHVAFAHAGAGDAHELRLRAHLLDAARAGVDHRGAQATGELVQDGHQAALVEHAAFDALGHQFLELAAAVLELTVGGAVLLRHGAQRTHAAV